MAHDDDATLGRVLARREVLALFGASAGATMLAAWAPERLVRASRFWSGTAAAADPSCVVRPELTEGPYFVDERLDRSDIRSDPGTGVPRPGVPLALTFAVSRIDGGSCVPFGGALVDVWHCDATGVYSDVRDGRTDTTGQRFLRGYQVTGADGTARFLTIYPGWYPGRAVHIHFKIRPDPDAAGGLEFTSQLFFDDALTDVVLARQPYVSAGQRTRNAGDGIYRNGGDQLLLAPGADGAGGYAARFDIGVAAGGVTTTTTTPPAGATPTTLGPASCATVGACLAELRGVLPDPTAAATRRAKHAALGLRRRAAKLTAVLERAAAASGARRQRLFSRAGRRLGRLLAASEAAAGDGTLGVSLAPIQAAIAALVDLV